MNNQTDKNRVKRGGFNRRIYAKKEKQKRGFFWVDQFTDWILGKRWDFGSHVRNYEREYKKSIT